MNKNDELRELSKGYFHYKNQCGKLSIELNSLKSQVVEKTGLMEVVNTSEVVDARGFSQLPAISEEQLSRTIEKMGDMQNENKALMKSMAKISASLDESNLANAALQDQIVKLKGQLAEAEGDKYKTLHENSESKMENLGKTKDELHELQMELVSVRQDNVTLQKENFELKNELKELNKIKSEAEDLRDAKVLLESKVKDLTSSLSNSVKELDRYKAKAGFNNVDEEDDMLLS